MKKDNFRTKKKLVFVVTNVDFDLNTFRIHEVNHKKNVAYGLIQFFT